MNFVNFWQIIRMILDKKTRSFILELHNLYKNDSNYSYKKVIRHLLFLVRGEKIIRYDKKFITISFYPPLPTKSFLQFAIASDNKETAYTQQIYAKRRAPLSTYIAITDKCNYNCKHCSIMDRKSGNELNTDQWIKFVKEIQNIGVSIIGFTGGEPLLRNDLEEILDAIDERSVTFLFTNGKGLTYERAKALKEAGLFAAAISLDSHDEQKFNDFRNNKNAFQNSIEAIKNSKRVGLYTMIQSVFLKKDLSKKNLVKLLKLGRKLKVNEIRLLEPIKSGRYVYPTKDENLFFDNAAREKLIKLQNKLNRRLRLPKLTSFTHFENKNRFGCNAGILHTYITPFGELLPCDFVPLSFGNIHQEDFKELWENMTKAMGIPRCNCFADTINNELQLHLEKGLPLPKDLSVKICTKNQSKDFPRAYQILQGKK